MSKVQYLRGSAKIHQVIDFGDEKVFEAIAYPTVVILEKDQAHENSFQALVWNKEKPIKEFMEVVESNSFAMPQSSLNPNGWQFIDEDSLRLLEKLRSRGTPLGEYVDGHFYYGIKTGLNKAFVVDRATRDRLIAEDPSSEDLLVPFLRGRDVKRWCIDYADQYLIKIESSENKKHPWSGKPEDEAEQIFANYYPSVSQYFSQFRDGLIKRCDQGKYFWELRSCAYWDDFSASKIIYPDIYEHQSFTYDRDCFFAGNTCYFIPTSTSWLCGLLNSRIIEWFYVNISNSVQGGYLRAFTNYMKDIPVPKATAEEKAAIADIVERCVEFERENITELETELNRLVGQLFNLTPDDWSIIKRSDR